ncbi:MAG TPA: UvrD-helicase domain-containing protein [Gemmataceae bacterium]|nr:UvrD-helicase domain-containing protein [Gemmataceae bacterium]
MPQDADHDLLADLTAAQREAVVYIDGPLLILAGAGSGKTRVITRRVGYLLHQGIKPYHILAITFTNKAAAEMRQRIEALVPESRVWISTFHSLGARLLRLYSDRLGLERNFTIYDQQDRNRLVKAALEAANIDNIRFTPERVEAAISKAKNQLLTADRYAERAGDFFSQTVARVYPIYEKKLRDANALDFDDLLLIPALALKQDPELRAELDARFRYVLIDEYQDTNSAQYAIARGLSVDYPNLCVVGDPDQSIYGWRGANIRNILDFERDFPKARVITLDRNYRSTKSILRAASHLIANNRQRKPKDLVTENPAGQPVAVLTFETGLDEADAIARRIRHSVQTQGRSYRDFAVFLRINALSRGLEAAFLKNRVPYQIVKGLAFFERKENRDVLAYLRLLLNPRDDLSFLRAVNEPARGVGKVSLEHLRAYAEPRAISLLEASGEVGHIPALKGKAAAGLRSFALLIHELTQLVDMPPDEVIRQVLDRSGYRQMLQIGNDPEDQERLANIEELITAAKQFAAEDSDRTLSDWLENITLASDVDSWDERQDCVSIMTLHSAKGLEFPVVYMAAVEQGLLPHERSLAKDEDVEEERRLAFVGITRAKQELYLCHARLREFRGQTLYAVPSMFLDELGSDGIEPIDLSASAAGRARAIDAWRGGSEAAEQGWADAGVSSRSRQTSPRTQATPPDEHSQYFAEGMLVHHDQYGTGRVTHVMGHGSQRKIKVRFRSAGERTFLAAKAKLTIVNKK